MSFVTDIPANKSQMSQINFVTDFPTIFMLCTSFSCYKNPDEFCHIISCDFSPLHQIFLLIRAKWNLSQLFLQFWCFAPDFPATKSQMNFVTDFPVVLMLWTRFSCYQDSDELCHRLSCCFSPLHQFFLMLRAKWICHRFPCSFDTLHQIFVLLRAKWTLSQISLRFWCFAPDFPAD